MLEINVLPLEHRTVEKTPLPVYLGLIGGGVLLLFSVILYLQFADKKRAEQDELNQLATLIAALRTQAAEVDQIQGELDEARQRVQNMVGIAQEKIFWSQKLDQLHGLMPPMVWLEQFAFGAPEDVRGVTEEPALILNCAARGNDPERVKKFLDRLEKDTNFSYHFKKPVMLKIDVVDANDRYDGEFVVREVSIFTVILRVKPSEFKALREMMAAEAAAGAPAPPPPGS